MTTPPAAVPPEVRHLLSRVMQCSFLSEFSLAGGTSLALRFGHRISVDLDLFTNKSFDAEALETSLCDHFDLAESSASKNTVTGMIEGIKTDFLAHRYPLLGKMEILDGYRLMAIEDVGAMKLNAIANRGRKKDFWDLAELLQRFSFDEVLGFYKAKYGQRSVWNLQKSLSYFDDAESDPDPVDLKGRSWEQVKAKILKANRL